MVVTGTSLSLREMSPSAPPQRNRRLRPAVAGRLADPDRRNRQGVGDLPRELRGHALEYECEAAGVLDTACIVEQSHGSIPTALHAVSADLVHRLRCHAEVPHDRHP
jgi:hypothetical protein